MSRWYDVVCCGCRGVEEGFYIGFAASRKEK
jgi:hypothetical protein